MSKTEALKRAAGKKELMKGKGTASAIRASLGEFAHYAKKGHPMLSHISEKHHISTVGYHAKREGDRKHKRFNKFMSNK